MEYNFYKFIFILLFILAGEYRKTAFFPKNKPLILVKKDHSSLSAKLFCLQIHFFSHRRIWDIWMDIQSSDTSPSSKRLMFPLFLDPCAWKKQPRKKDHDAGNETRLPVARLSWQSAPLYLCSTLLPFHSLRYFTNHSAMAPEGKTAENRMWIHLPLTSTLGETCAAVQAVPTCLLDVLPCCCSVKQNHVIVW